LLIHGKGRGNTREKVQNFWVTGGGKKVIVPQKKKKRRKRRKMAKSPGASLNAEKKKARGRGG